MISSLIRCRVFGMVINNLCDSVSFNLKKSRPIDFVYNVGDRYSYLVIIYNERKIEFWDVELFDDYWITYSKSKPHFLCSNVYNIAFSLAKVAVPA
jgi:hypothetical protein